MEPMTPTTSPTTTSSTFTSSETLVEPLDILSTRELLGSMQAASRSLGDIFDDLQSQTMHVALLDEAELAPEICKLRRQMKAQDQIHLEGVAEIRREFINPIFQSIETARPALRIKYFLLFDDVYLTAQEEIDREIDALVQEQVAECLKMLIPQDLQDEVAVQKRELEDLRVQLHNSESRRANAALRSSKPDDPLRVIYMANGEVSEHYPKSLKDLFNLDADRCKALMLDYELPDVSDARDRNLNLFMQFCGVTYQMVRTGSATRRVGMEPAAVRTSVLSKLLTMGEQTPVNMFSGSPLNRLSWLRSSHPFLNTVIALPATRWLLFNSGQPLVVAHPDAASKQILAYLSTNDVKPFLGSEPSFGQGRQEGQLVVESKDIPHSPTEAIRHRNSPVVFLGLQEHSKVNALPSSDFADPEAAIANLDGTPYFSMDVAELDLSPERLKEILDTTSLAQNGQILSWSEPRVLMTGLDYFSGAVFAEARSLVDWNLRNKFCPGCGARTYSMWGGWKISCSSMLPWANNADRKPCPTTKGLHNFTHPRTDPVVIMIAIDETGDKILLGRGRKFPGKFYSALAGFIEPGETFEDAVAREMWEEAGVTVWDVRYHSGQPWPYPANLMVGFYARADSSQPIRVDLDNELVDARWYTREEIISVLHHPIGGKFGSAEYKKMAESTEGRNNQQESPHLNPTYQPKAPESKSDDPPFRLPPVTAIAGLLIRDWVEGKIGFSNDNSGKSFQKGNL
ncbi:putative NADH pyrophosphatase [Hypsizygus marmoreus]|uniref:NAD(+) diphosphatase n=1 Tax=Hypsizygus marmoreus TaxID=39966 RepID=A0A369K254_HYPMA|nr:putative NADH pyrophosphatase [Hypsizygus marmoreus]